MESNSAKRDLGKSRPLDVHRWSDYAEANAFVDGIHKHQFKDPLPSIPKKHLKVLLLDLYVAWLDDPEQCIAVHMGNDMYRAKSRYNDLRISRLMPKIVRRLNSIGLIEMAIGFHSHGADSGRLTRIWPTASLVVLFKKAQLTRRQAGTSFMGETIRLKGPHKRLIEYEDTEQTSRMRAAVERYNALLKATEIACALPYVLDTQNKKLWLDEHKRVHRIFNEGSFEKGGRFYGGWWMSLKEEDRKHITINGEPTIEIDYVALHPLLLYARLGVDYWKHAKQQDIYTIPVPELQAVPSTIQRMLIKSLVLVCLNTKSEQAAFNAFRGSDKFVEIKNTACQMGIALPSMTNALLGSILNAFKRSHPLIQKYMCSGVAVSLQYQDSCIAERVISAFTASNIPVLSVHDSFIVQLQHESKLSDEMVDALYVETRLMLRKDTITNKILKRSVK